MIHHRVLNVIRDRTHLYDLSQSFWRRPEEGPFYVYAGRGRDPITNQLRREPAHPDLGNPFTLEQHGPECMRLWLDYLRDDSKGRKVAEWAIAPFVVSGYNFGPESYVFGCYCAGRYPTCHAEPLARLGDGELLPAIRADILHRLELDQRQVRLFPEATP